MENENKKSSAFKIVIALVIVIIIGLGVWYFSGKKSSQDKQWDLALKPSNLEDCVGLDSVEFRDECYMRMATVNMRDKRVCSKISSSSFRALCESFPKFNIPMK